MRATDIEQAPLAVCQADFMLCSVELRRFGVDYDRVADEVLRDMLMRMTIESADMVQSNQMAANAGSEAWPQSHRYCGSCELTIVW